ncbi:MAG: tetratricopeptide repeat protein [Alicyclobacillus sp.]|nr:tetratricopeptide repeat protein [Alicyclobacillus sp.]
MDTHTGNEWRQGRRKRAGNVISMRLDAAFFHERGVRYLQRNDLKRALQAFRKTVEYEPDNPVNHCNLAGVLSEMGDFEASNEVLLHILRDLDPSMAECQFYLANNYANMGEYATAEEYVLRYLDAAPDGEYAEDAEEMLDVLLDEFGGGKAYAEWSERHRARERAAAERDGRHLLEEGHFEAAVEWLEQVIAAEPDNVAARNNLSLAYYYTGQYERAIATAESVLAEQPRNIHALCNLAVFTAQLGPKERMQACVLQLKKVFPLHYDQAMKVGTTLGLVGEHEAALDVFQRLMRVVEKPEPALVHSLAAAAANTGRFALARRWWKALHKEPEMAEVAQYYLDLLQRAQQQGKRMLRASYQSELPLHVQFQRMKKRLHEGNLATWRQDPVLRASLYWGLRHGDGDTRKAVVRTLALISDEDAVKALRLFLKRPDVDASLQAAALCALQSTGCRGRVEINRDGRMESVRMSDLPGDLILGVDASWADVWERAQARLRDTGHARAAAAAKRIWVRFLRRQFLQSELRIARPEVWAAGLVYVALKGQRVSVRQREVAELFQVSPSSVSKVAVRLLDAVATGDRG